MTHFRSLLFGELQRIDLRRAALRDGAAPTQADEDDALHTLKRRCISALIRMNERTYGECQVCAELIALERLIAAPWEECCQRCAERAVVDA